VPIVLAQGVGLVCGLASMKLNSHLVPPAVLGFYGVFLTFTPIGMWVVYAGLLKFVSRYWAAASNRPGLAREVLVVWRRRLAWLALLAGAAALAIARLDPAGTVEAGLALFWSAALLALGALAQNALQAERAHWRDCAVASSGALTRSFLPPLLFAATGGASAALLFGFSLHSMVVALAGAWALRSVFRPAAENGRAPALTAAYEGPMFTAIAVSNWLLGGLNRWLVAWFFGNVEAGYYTLMGGAAVIVTSMLGTIMIQYLQPGLFALGDGLAATKSTLARRTDLAALSYAGLAGAALVGLNALAPLLVGSLISPVYRDALHWLLPAGCFAIATMTAIFYHVMLLAGGREKACGPVDLTSAGILAAGCLAGAVAGQVWLTRWLLVTPLIPWLLTRTLARYYFFKPGAGPTPAPGR
jgi:hypothetical protein